MVGHLVSIFFGVGLCFAGWMVMMAGYMQPVPDDSYGWLGLVTIAVGIVITACNIALAFSR